MSDHYVTELYNTFGQPKEEEENYIVMFQLTVTRKEIAKRSQNQPSLYRKEVNIGCYMFVTGFVT